MKSTSKLMNLKMAMATLFFTLVQLVVMAQDSASTATTTTSTSSNTKVNITEGGEWYTSPWVWVAGAAVFILLLIALLRGGGGSSRRDTATTDRVTVTKTVERDRDTDAV